MLVLADRVQQTGTANTTVSFTLSGAVTGFQSFSTIGNTNTTYYSAFDTAGNWETGLGTYSTTGPTLTRTTIYQSSNSNAAVTFSGSVNVFVTYPAGRSVNLDSSSNVSALGTVASGTWQGTTVGVAYGGTGRTVGSYSVFSNEIHVSKDGNDTTGDGTLINPVLTITKALTLIAGLKKTVIVHPGDYPESPTVSTANTTIATSELTGANTTLSGTLTLSAAARVSGLKMTNLTITGSGSTYISNCTIDTRVIKSGTNYVEIINTEMQCTLGVQISGTGTVSIVGNKCWAVAVSNASASVLIKDCFQVITPSVTAGTLNIDGCAIFASSPASNAVTSSVGSFITLANSFVLNSAGTSVERVSLSGSYSILNLVYDKTNSTFAGTNLNAIDYFSVLNAETLISSNGLVVNNMTIGASYTIPTGYSASSVGPVSLSSGVTVTVPTGSRWVVS